MMPILGFLFCLTTAITGLISSVSQPPRDPERKPPPIHIRVVANTVGWVRPYYVWRNKNAILIFRGNENYETLDSLEEYRLDTEEYVTFDAINRQWRDNPLQHTNPTEKYFPGETGGLVQAAVSPDGKWIVWLAGRANVGGAQLIWMTISLDGKHWTERPRYPGSYGIVVWSHDSQSGIGLFDTWIDQLHDKEHFAGVVYNVYNGKERRFDFSIPVTPHGVDYGYWDLLAQRSNGHLILEFVQTGDHPKSEVFFADIPLAREKGAPKQWAIHMPPNAYIFEVALSPIGDRLIWNLRFEAPGYSYNRPLSEAERKQERSEIWLSRLDGSGMQRLGNLVFDISLLSPDDPNFFEGPRLVGLQWSPDGKRISYIYDKALYLVTVP
jgi:hypothetical protein